MSQYAIQVENLGKEYIIGSAERRHVSFREMLSGALTAPLRRLRKLGGIAREEERFWALKDVSFNVEQGEVLGIIGGNGAGKSTLLKVLSRITSPTEGRVITRGRLASLLEVGTGFHPELTGRENIYLNGSILGMSRQEITKVFDEIVAFSEVERFLDTPVKRFSSGMYVRLAFAVAAHLESEILLVDEVLAVGDAEFQKRCLGKMSSVAGEGRTVLFVSHNLGAVAKLCSRGLLLSCGLLAADAGVHDALAAYAVQSAERTQLDPGEFFGPLTQVLRFTHLAINGRPAAGLMTASPFESIRLEVHGHAAEPIPDYRTTFALRRDGQHLVSLHDRDVPEALTAGEFQASVVIPEEFLSPGEYAVEIGGYSTTRNVWTWGRDQAVLTVVSDWRETYDTRANMGLVNLPGRGGRVMTGAGDKDVAG